MYLAALLLVSGCFLLIDARWRLVLFSGAPRRAAAVLAAATTLWAVLVGAISLETFGQYGTDTFAHPEQLFRLQIEQTLAGLFA